MARYFENCRVEDAPQEIRSDCDYFVYRRNDGTDAYCGAFCKKKNGRTRLFLIPGAIRADGLFSDPLEARDALNKYLEGLKK